MDSCGDRYTRAWGDIQIWDRHMVGWTNRGRGGGYGHTEGGMDTLGEDTQVGTNIQGKRIPVVSDS